MENIVKDLILARLLAPGKTGLAPGKIQKELEPLTQHLIAGAEWKDLFERCWESLREEGCLQITQKGKSTQIRLSEIGQARALEYLGVLSVPASITWPALKNNYWVPKALGITPDTEAKRKMCATAAGLKTVIVKNAYNLNVGEKATFKQVLDTLLWKQLGVESIQAFTLSAVQEHLLNRLLNSEVRVPLKKAKEVLPLKAIGARRGDAAELRNAILRRLLDEPKKQNFIHLPERHDSLAPSALTRQPDHPLSLFAKRVQEAARSTQTGRFGPNKVFISHVWRTFLHQGDNGLTVETFKQRLTEANHAGLLKLSRADLVEAMDPTDVKESETVYLNSLFHFIRIGED